MKKNYLLGLALSIVMAGSVSAQQVRNCGTMHHLHELEAQDPGLTDRMQRVERETQQWINQSNTAQRGAAVVTIPVVVHVVYNTSAQNISDAQINSQINILNQDFRKLNADVSLLPSVFSALAADCEIQFCLAQRDPQGLATNGIVRRSTTTTSFSSNNAIKSSTSGGSSPWPSNAYLNIWVGNLSGGLLGYAQFPGGAASTDGVVVNYTAFGNTGTAAAPFNKGRTATHEVGHWLNLRHIWGDATCGDDFVGDTPTQQTANYGCPAFPRVTCNNGPNGDLHMNYMDYTDDACMYMFTTGQKTRMLASLNTTRASLLTSQGCVPPVAAACSSATGLTVTGITTTTATLNWAAVSGATSYNVRYKAVSATAWTTISSTSLSLALTGLTSGTTYEFQVQVVCSAGTGNFSASTNWTTTAVSCNDVYESNNTRNAAKTIAVNTDIFAKIGTSSDKDWFRFSTVSGSTNLKVVLDQLPADYDIRLYNSSGSTLATSALSGTSAETIIRNTTAAATYFVQIYPYSTASINTNLCYRLRINTSGTAFRGDAPVEFTEGNENPDKINPLEDVLVYPNPASDLLNINFFNPEDGIVSAEVIDMLGKTVMNTTINAGEGFNRAEMNISSVMNGIYFLRLQQNGEYVVRKFIVKH